MQMEVSSAVQWTHKKRLRGECKLEKIDILDFFVV